MFVKPNTGCAVRDPVKGTLLPNAGAEVPDTSFWRRRLRDGDVSVVVSAQTTSATADKAALATTTTAAEDTK